MSSSLATRIDALIAARLKEVGFVEKRPGIFLIAIKPTWDGWIGLNQKIEPHSYEVNPTIGVRSANLEKTLSELNGERDSGYKPPSLSTTLRYLMGNPEDRWTFDEGR